MNTFTNIKDLNRSLIGLSPDIFTVKIASVETGNSSTYSPSDAMEWMLRYADSIVTSNKDAVLLQVGDRQFRLSVWRNTPQRVDLMGI